MKTLKREGKQKKIIKGERRAKCARKRGERRHEGAKRARDRGEGKRDGAWELSTRRGSDRSPVRRLVGCESSAGRRGVVVVGARR